MYDMRRRKPYPTLLPSQWILKLPCNIVTVWAKLAFDDAVSYVIQSGEMDYSTVKLYGSDRIHTAVTKVTIWFISPPSQCQTNVTPADINLQQPTNLWDITGILLLTTWHSILGLSVSYAITCSCRYIHPVNIKPHVTGSLRVTCQLSAATLRQGRRQEGRPLSLSPCTQSALIPSTQKRSWDNGQSAVLGQKKVSQTRGKRVWIAKSHFRKCRFQKQWETQS